jgi:hypothetical protein
MNYRGNNNQCDICANKYPCLHCGGRGKDGAVMSNNTLFNALYGKTVIKKVLLKFDGQVVISDIGKELVKDLGWSSFVPLNSIPEYDKTLFGIPDMPTKDIFPKNVIKIERTKTVSTDQGVSQVFVGWFEDEL